MVDGSDFSYRELPLKKRYQEREIYGIFAESDSDGSEDGYGIGFGTGGNAKRGHSRRKDGQADIAGSTSLDFVKGGTLNPSEKQVDHIEAEFEGERTSRNRDEDEDDASVVSEEDLIDRILEDDTFDYSNEKDIEEDDDLAILRASRELMGMETKLRQRKQRHKYNKASAHDPDIGIHTQKMNQMYGTGLKMLKKMGYKGGGLGRDGTGVVAPIEVKARRRQQGLQNEKELGESTRELLKQMGGVSNAPNAKAVTYSRGWYAYSRKASRTEDTTYSSDMATEIDDLISDLQDKVSLYDKIARDNFSQMQNEERYKTEVQHDIANLEVRLKAQERLLSQCEEASKRIMETCEKLETELESLKDRPDEAACYPLLQRLFNFFSNERESGSDVYDTLNCDQIASCYARRCLDVVFHNWRVENDYNRGVDILSLCNLFFSRHQENREISNHIKSVLEDRLVQYFSEHWALHDTDEGLKCYETWSSVISPLDSGSNSIIAKIKDTILVRFLEYMESGGKPHTAHIIIHPWLSIFGHEDIYRIISGFKSMAKKIISKEAVSNIKRCQHIIHAWDSLLDQEGKEDIKGHLCAHLVLLLKEVEINPRNQDTRIIEAIMPWHDYLGGRAMASVFCREFMSRWLTLLKNWLNLPSANLEEVILWYRGWKSIFPAAVLKSHELETFFRNALHEMDKVSSEILNEEAGASNQKADEDDYTAEQSVINKVMSLGENHGITLLKRHGLLYEGKQVYAFGPASIAFDGDRILLIQKGSTTEITAEELMDAVR